MKYTKAMRRADLVRRLSGLGFNHGEIQRLRRIQMTLHRWAEAECNGEIERDEATGKPERVSQAWINGMADKRYAWPVPDRESGALKRLAAIVDERNRREKSGDTRRSSSARHVTAYHQGDPRGCALYLLTREQLTGHDGEALSPNQYYTRGLAVCD